MDRLTFRMSIVGTALLLCACGGDNPQEPTGPANPGDGAADVRPGARLAWTQAAPSGPALRAHAFTLLVDDSEAPFADVRCNDERGPAGFECSGRLPSMSPGVHVLTLVATWNGQRGPASPPLRVNVRSGLQAAATDSIGATTAPEDVTAPCALRSGATCYEAWLVSEKLREVTGFAMTSADRLLYVEDGRAVRAVEAGRLLPAEAYAPDRSGDRIVGLAVDASAERGGPVYLAWTERGRDGTPSLNVSRFRELAGVLGEGATIVSGLPVPDEGAVPLAVDDRGLVYVALPRVEAAGHDVAYSGHVLRFAPDGRVPDANPRMSPVFASGMDAPRALTFDAVRRRVWVAGADRSRERALGWIDVDPPPGSPWPLRLAVARPEEGPRPADAGAFEALGAIEHAVTRADGASYVAVRTREGTVSVLLLVPR